MSRIHLLSGFCQNHKNFLRKLPMLKDTLINIVIALGSVYAFKHACVPNFIYR